MVRGYPAPAGTSRSQWTLASAPSSLHRSRPPSAVSILFLQRPPMAPMVLRNLHRPERPSRVRLTMQRGRAVGRSLTLPLWTRPKLAGARATGVTTRTRKRSRGRRGRRGCTGCARRRWRSSSGARRACWRRETRPTAAPQCSRVAQVTGCPARCARGGPACLAAGLVTFGLSPCPPASCAGGLSRQGAAGAPGGGGRVHE